MKFKLIPFLFLPYLAASVAQTQSFTNLPQSVSAAIQPFAVVQEFNQAAVHFPEVQRPALAALEVF